MEKRDKTLIIIAIAICVVICCLSPFIASGDPDGLEKSAEDAAVPENVTKEVVASPIPDYTYEPLAAIGEVGVLILGVLLTLLCGLAIGKLVQKKKLS